MQTDRHILYHKEICFHFKGVPVKLEQLSIRELEDTSLELEFTLVAVGSDELEWFDYRGAGLPVTPVTFQVDQNGNVLGNMLEALGPLSNDMLYRFSRSFRASSDAIEPIMHKLPVLILRHFMPDE